MTPSSRTWKADKYIGIEARRTGYCILPDFASTAHMIQGAALDAVFSDAQEASASVSMAMQIAAYIAFTRIKELVKICVLQPFSPWLFAPGPPRGPERLIRKLSGQITSDEALIEWINEDTPVSDSVDKASGDPMTQKYRCTSCYLKRLRCICTQYRSLVFAVKPNCSRSTSHRATGRGAWHARPKLA